MRNPEQRGVPGNALLTIGATSSDGIFQLTDTRPGGDGLLFVTVRDMVGDGCLDMSYTDMVREMRRLTRRAYHGHVRRLRKHHPHR